MLIKQLRPIRLDLYILSEVVTSFIGVSAFITFFLLMFQILRLGEVLISRGVIGTILAKMAGLLVISILPSSIPLAFLIGLLAAFSRLSNDSEIIAVKASGISLLRIAMPTFFLAGAIGIFLSQLNNHWVPSSITTYKSLEEKVRNTKVSSIIKEGAFTSGFFDMLIYAEKVDRKKNRLQKVFIFD
jgi:lipopolysaccharide export system permease protein